MYPAWRVHHTCLYIKGRGPRPSGDSSQLPQGEGGSAIAFSAHFLETTQQGALHEPYKFGKLFALSQQDLSENAFVVFGILANRWGKTNRAHEKKRSHSSPRVNWTLLLTVREEKAETPYWPHSSAKQKETSTNGKRRIGRN